MVQIAKYAVYLLAFFFTLQVVVWTKYSISPEEKTTKTERKLSYEEATQVLKGSINYKTTDYFEGSNSVVKISTDYFLTFKRDTLTYESSYYSRDKE